MSLNLSYRPFDLHFKHAFTVSGFSRTTTPIVLIQIEYQGVIGYGEATMPPYLGESQESVISFLSKIDLSGFNSPYDINALLDMVDAIAPGNNAAKAGFDIALHDLVSKLSHQSVAVYYHLQKTNPLSSFTIGIDSIAKMLEKVNEASLLGFKILKIKLGVDNDEQIMKHILEVWKGPFSIDANQGWSGKEKSLDFSYYLKENGALFIEQPFLKEDLKTSSWLTERSPLPVIADESVKRLVDLSSIKDSFHGINVKLMKSTGLREAYKMILEAKQQNMKVVTGCMAESSCAVAAMYNLASLADWVDLDGPFLITNDPFSGVQLKDGRLTVKKI